MIKTLITMLFLCNSVNAQDNNQTIINQVFFNKSHEERETLKKDLNKYTEIQYGFNTDKETTVKTNKKDAINNIKSTDPKLIDKRIELMKDLANKTNH